jgi:hypothetical protein
VAVGEVAIGDGEVATGDGLAVAVGVVFGAGLVATPLFQINFFPLLMQVNFLPPEIEILPAFVQGAPALVAAVDWITPEPAKMIRAARRAKFRISGRCPIGEI